MSEALKRYAKRICREFEYNGETYHVRGLTNGEIERANKLEEGLKTFLYMGCGLLDEGGGQIFTQGDDDDATFASRVKAEMQSVPLPMMRRAMDEIVKTTMPPTDMEAFIKNSAATAT